LRSAKGKQTIEQKRGTITYGEKMIDIVRGRGGQRTLRESQGGLRGECNEINSRERGPESTECRKLGRMAVEIACETKNFAPTIRLEAGVGPGTCEDQEKRRGEGCTFLVGGDPFRGAEAGEYKENWQAKPEATTGMAQWGGSSHRAKKKEFQSNRGREQTLRILWTGGILACMPEKKKKFGRDS